MMSSNRRVFRPLAVRTRFPCIGSHAHTTGIAASRTAREERRKLLADVRGAHPRDEREPARDAVGVEPLRQRDRVVRCRRRPELHADRVPDAGEELDVRAAELSRAVSDPEHVRRAVVRLTGERVGARERLLVLEEKALVARPDVDLVERSLGRQVDPDRLHEAERTLDLARQRLVALAGGRARHELAVPRVDVREIGEPALRERPQEVEGGRRLVVGVDEALGVGHPRLRRRLVRVDDVAAKRRQLDAVDDLGRAARGFAN